MKKENPYLISNIDSLKKYLNEYDSKSNYSCSIFPIDNTHNLIFPKGTFSYIGARTGRGKTTALVSIAMDAIKDGKKVIFVTTEETPNQILIRMILNSLFNGGYNFDNDMDFSKTQKWKNMLLQKKNNSREEVRQILKGENVNLEFIDEEISKIYKTNAFKSQEKIENLLKNNILSIYDGLLSPKFEFMLDTIKDCEEGSVVLFDYIQHLRTPAGYENNSRQIQIQEASHRISDLMANKNLIGISGAQFGRSDEDKKTNLPDTLAEGLFRESGDIEQDAHNAIGIGRHQFANNEKNRFYSVIKARESDINGSRYKLLDAFSYSHTEAIRGEFGLIDFNFQKSRKEKKESKIYVTDTDSENPLVSIHQKK